MSSHAHAIQVEGAKPIAFSCQADETLLAAALRQGLGFPYECHSGGCASCLYELRSGEVEDLWPNAPGLDAGGKAAGMRLACQTRPLSDCAIKLRLKPAYVPPVRPARLRAILIDSVDLTHDMREFRFQTTEPARFRPGQYALLRLPGVTGARAYSMSNLPSVGEGLGDWHFVVRRTPLGQGSAVLFDRLTVGASVELEGPYGNAWLRTDTPRDIVCVGGGSGLSPMLSILRGALDAPTLDTTRLRLFYGARTPLDDAASVAFKREPALASRVQLVCAVSSGVDPGWHGEQGFVHEVLERHLTEPAAAHDFYFCGPPPMTNALQELLVLKHRVPAAQLHFDRFF